MKLYFAAVGNDRLPMFNRVHKNLKRKILFSFYDLTLGPWQFRKNTWKILLKEKTNRIDE